jgi:hypothetical protein
LLKPASELLFSDVSRPKQNEVLLSRTGVEIYVFSHQSGRRTESRSANILFWGTITLQFKGPKPGTVNVDALGPLRVGWKGWTRNKDSHCKGRP